MEAPPQSGQRGDQILQLLSDAIENSLNGFDIVNADGKIIYANRAYLKMWGYNSLGEVFGKSPLAHFADPAIHDQVVSALSEKGETIIEFTGRRNDGTEFDVLMYAIRAHDQDGREIFTGTSLDITERKRAEAHLRSALEELKEIKERIAAENVTLRRRIREIHTHESLVGGGPVMREIHLQIDQVAATDATVLVLGETGTGKELVARAIHESSSRRHQPFVAINCAAIPEALIESELFGHEKGAYSSAHAKQIGRFEAADGGTVFLDEIGELKEAMQAKLLRTLEEGQIERLGGNGPRRIDVRIIAATNRDLEAEASKGRFRRDLYYRLNVFPITIPPLRERRSDLVALVWHFVEEFSTKMGKKIEAISTAGLEAIAEYSWPGNIRELRNIVERAMIRADSSTLQIELPAPGGPGAPSPSRKLDDVQRHHIAEVLRSTGWKIRGSGGAAEILGLNPSTLDSRIKKLGIRRPRSG